MTTAEKRIHRQQIRKELPMNPKQHAALNQFFYVYRLVAPLFIFGILIAPVPVTVIVLFLYFGPCLLTWLIPVKCTRMGCASRMKVTTERTSFWRAHLHFRCDTCCKVYQEEIFNPDIEVTAEFSF